jgi:hypothetical protein
MVGGLMHGAAYRKGLMATWLFLGGGGGGGCGHAASGEVASQGGPAAAAAQDVIGDRSWTMAYQATVDADGDDASFDAALNLRRSGPASTSHVVLRRSTGPDSAPLVYELPGELSLPEGGRQTSVVPVLALRVRTRPVYLYQPIDPDLLPPSLGFRPAPEEAAGDVHRAIEVGPLDLPLTMPAGELIMAARDAGGAPRLLGRRSVDELAPGARLELTGKLAPGLHGRRRAELEVVDRDAHQASEHIALTVENRGDQPADVVILDALIRARRWRIIEAGADSGNGRVDKYDEHTVRLGLRVPAHTSGTVDYRVAYAW